MIGKTLTTTAVALAIVVAALLTACGGDDNDTAPAGTATANSSQFAGDLIGTYERTVTEADLERTADFRKLDPGFEMNLAGPYRLVIEKGAFTVIDPENFPVAQNVAATEAGNFDVGDYVNPQEGAFCGQSIPQGAIYSWTLEDDVLTLKAESDSCADRDSVLSGEWRRSEG